MLNLLWQIYDIFAWGVVSDWHFKDSLGWGFGWLTHVELHVVALLLIAPFVMFVGSGVPLYLTLNRRLVTVVTLVGLILFILLSILQTQLEKSLP
jgi:hypothetical protein